MPAHFIRRPTTVLQAASTPPGADGQPAAEMVVDAVRLEHPAQLLRPRRGPQVLRRVVVVHDALGLREPVVEQPPHPAGAVADREADVLRRVARRSQFAQQAALEC